MPFRVASCQAHFRNLSKKLRPNTCGCSCARLASTPRYDAWIMVAPSSAIDATSLMTLSHSHSMSSVSVRGMVQSAEARIARVGAALLLTLLALALCAGNASAQQRSSGTHTLSLDEALRIAQTQSQAIDIAKAGVTRATGQRLQARSQAFPQLSASAGYGRTLESQFSGFTATATPDTAPRPVASQTLCTPFVPANATAAERQAALAQAATCPASGGGGFDLSKTSFGAKNQYQAAVNFSQTVYSGGRIQAQTAAADAQIRSADIDVAAQRAQTSLDVTSAYYDAVLADKLARKSVV